VTLLRIGILAVALSIGGTLAFAASGGRTGGSVAKTPSCQPSEIWDSASGKCAKKTGTLDDKQLYQEGRDLALSGRFDDALVELNAVKLPDSMTLTMIGYATGKLGNRDLALAYYHMALAADPNNVNAHEYLGRDYAEQGQVDLAKGELAKIAATCGKSCNQYEDLAEAIAGVRSGT
jgi:tetratricopeptide (TPR) repeat protein